MKHLFYSIAEAAALLECDINDILKFGAAGELQLSAFITGDIEEGYTCDEDPEDPDIARMRTRKYHVRNRLMPLRQNDLITLYKETTGADNAAVSVRLMQENEDGKYIKLRHDDTITCEKLFITSEELDRFKETMADVELSALGITGDHHSAELRIAIEASNALYADPPAKTPPGGHRRYIGDWLVKNYPDLSYRAKERIITVINPNPKGGAPRT